MADVAGAGLGRRADEVRGSHKRAAALLRRVAELEPTRLPLLSVYLDLRPPGDAADPAVRATRIVFRDRMREIQASFPAHGPEHDSVTADGERLREAIEAAAGQHERGLVAFACHGQELFETLLTWVPFDDRVEVGPLPFLVPLARLVDSEPAVVALADTNSLRLFVSAPGRLVELPAIDDPPDDYTRTEAGGWSQARFQRHVDEHRAEFARRAAALIERTMDREDARRLILAGDEVAIPRLREALSKPVGERVDEVIRLELRAALDEIEAKALPVLERLDDDAARDAADRLVGAIRAGGLGVGGLLPTRTALLNGQAMELLLDARVATAQTAESPAPGLLAEADANELVRLAARTDARIRFVPDHEGLLDYEGVGALLRFRV